MDKQHFLVGASVLGFSFVSGSAKADGVISMEPTVNIVATRDGTVGPGVVLDGGYEIPIVDEFRITPSLGQASATWVKQHP
jgi:hypothetical protein